MKKTFENPDIQVQSLVSDAIMLDLSSWETEIDQVATTPAD